MAWRGGFTGVGFTRSEFKAWLATQKRPPYVRAVVHNTDAPYIKPPVSGPQRIANLKHFYQNNAATGKQAGPDLFVLGEDKVYLGTPFGGSVGCAGWNGNSFHVECEGQYTAKSKQDPTVVGSDAAKAWDTMAWVFAEIFEWMGWPVDDSHLKLHKEGNTTHDCPGALITKTWFMTKVLGARAGSSATLVTAAPSVPAQSKEAWVTNVPADDFLNTRKGPGTTYAVNGKLVNGIKVSVLQETGSWAYIKTPLGFLVWVNSKYLSPTAPSTATEAPTQPLAATPVPSTPEAPKPLGSDQDRPGWLMAILQKECGWPKHWAAGFGGNAQREAYPDLRVGAAGDKDAETGKATAFTIWQLRDDRHVGYKAFAEKLGKPELDFHTQVLWPPQELKTSEKLAWKWLQLATTIEQATAAGSFYERPAGYLSKPAKAAATWDDVMAVAQKVDGWDVRLKFAKALYAKY